MENKKLKFLTFFFSLKVHKQLKAKPAGNLKIKKSQHELWKMNNHE